MLRIASYISGFEYGVFGLAAVQAGTLSILAPAPMSNSGSGPSAKHFANSGSGSEEKMPESAAPTPKT